MPSAEIQSQSRVERAEHPQHVQPNNFNPVSHSDNRVIAQHRQAMTMPTEFGQCQIVDNRSVGQKLWDFGSAAVHRAADPENYKRWAAEEQQKVLGIGEGLNQAKEDVKKAAGNTATAVVDGRAASAIMHAPETMKTAATAAVHVAEAVAGDPHAGEHVVKALSGMIQKASADYTALSPREKGRIIGHAMFAAVNPEGSTEVASDAIKAADNIATHVDAAVVGGIKKSMQAIDDMTKTAPELAQQAKQMLREYTSDLGLNGKQLEAAGVPSEYWSGIKPVHNHSESFYAAAKKDPLEGWKPADEAYRGDQKAHSAIGQDGKRKSHLNMEGDLCPASLKGKYNNEDVTVGHHLDGKWNQAAKANSPFTSFSVEDDVVKWGTNHKITLNVKELRAAIASGEVTDVEILERPEILKKIDESPFKDAAKDKFRARAIKHNELLVKGKIPARFLTVEP